jgi:hypothetical protein
MYDIGGKPKRKRLLEDFRVEGMMMKIVIINSS